MGARSAVQRAAQISLAPFTLLSGAKSFRDNAVIGSRRLNQLGLHVGRIRLADALTDQRRARLGRQLSAADRAHYAEHGYLIRENLLPADQFEALRQEVYGNSWPLLEMGQGSTITRRVVLNRAELRSSHPTLEQLLADFGAAYGQPSVIFRYFNAAGADPAGDIGENHDPETHLIPLVLEALAGRRPSIQVYGRDYPTADGTCIRDYIHVSDLAAAHVLGLERLRSNPGQWIYNLGTGSGYSVQQVIEAARSVTGRELTVVDASRRPGDPAELVADAALARTELGWGPQRSELATILADAWRWHQRNWASA